jgi:hypothetical protein
MGAVAGRSTGPLDSTSMARVSYATVHWRIFNVLLRIMGIWWFIGGTVFVLCGVYYTFTPAPKNAVFIFGPSVDYTVIGVIVVLAAVFMLRVKPYRPDLGIATSSRRWLTGDEPKE